MDEIEATQKVLAGLGVTPRLSARRLASLTLLWDGPLPNWDDCRYLQLSGMGPW